jgi:uncharacterized flavoprotein (TIGR03862 family)
MPRVAVIGGGPAGLMAAEVLASGGVTVDLFDAMPSVGRKFLLAGRGGLNLTHSEPTPALLQRYAGGGAALPACVEAFDGEAVRAWAHGLGITTFVGTSGRVFPAEMKAAPLLRAWMHRLRHSGVRFHARHRWCGWDAEGALRFETLSGDVRHTADATVLALGGASWPRLGSDGAWVPLLGARGVAVAPLQPSNCGFDVAPTAAGREGWSDHLRERVAGQPVKNVAARMRDGDPWQPGEFVVTAGGVEGGLVYAFSGALRDRLAAHGVAQWHVDLLPQFDPDHVRAEVARPRGSRSLSTHLKSRLGLQGVKMALLHELVTAGEMNDPAVLAQRIKALPIPLARPRPLPEAISTAGGVRIDAFDPAFPFMLAKVPGTFCAGEMLDWDAPTGGYLLTACFATGRAAAQGALAWIARDGGTPHGG